MEMLQERSWRCPTCLEILFKPTVNSACGHIYCFWCLHKAMSPYTPSACPVCRAKYAHLPAICTKLHHFLQCQFPEAYTLRRQEVEAEEKETGSGSPDPGPDGPLPSPTAPSSWQPLHFACDNPACGKLLCRPMVLNCGHAVCGPTCLPREGGRAGDLEGCRCPACGMVARQHPAPCKQLADLLAELFPQETQDRQQECQWALNEQHEASGRPLQSAAVQQAAQAGQAGSATQAEAVGARVAPPAGPEQQQQQQQQQQALSPSLEAALQRRMAAGGPGSELAQRLESSLRELTGDAYVHHGVGCDGCGLYPIQGRRYQCRDCPDAMGFDLCGACMDAGLSDVTGRFNQRHTPAHTMRLVRPRITALHMLQAANPGMPLEQLLWLLELAMGGGDDDDPQPAAPGGQQQQQQQQELGQPGSATGPGSGHSPSSAQQPPSQMVQHSSGSDESSIPLLRRGPRPAFDPTAQEPSPSAYAPRQHAGAMAGGSGTSQPPRDTAQGVICDGDEEWEEVHVPAESMLGTAQAPN